MSSSLAVHAVCLGLCAADYLARAMRIQLLTRSVDRPLGYSQAMAVNMIGDAACSLTPLRLGGEPARLGVMLRGGVTPTAAVVAITSEIVTAWPVILMVAALLGWLYAPEWWSAAGPTLADAARAHWPWFFAIVMGTVMVWWWVGRAAPARWNQPLRRTLEHWRALSWPVLLATAHLSFNNLAARVAILPVLATTLPDPPSLGTLLIGSFALLYSQLFLPTPSGAGAVDAGFMAGAAGELGSGVAGLLLAWRFYTSGVGIVLGVTMGVHHFGWSTVRGWVRGRRAANLPPVEP